MSDVVSSVESREMLPYHGLDARSIENKDFIAWDGEGITPEGHSRQNYVLFGNSKGFQIKGESLSTEDCFSTMLDTERMYPNAIHVGFAFGYDVEMILKDLTIRHLYRLNRTGVVNWQGYRIEYRKGKYFQISRRKPEHIVCRIWDVWSFFSTSFLVAMNEYLGPTDDVQRIESGKAKRGQFTYDELDTVMVPYWQTELRLLVDIMNTLRTRLYDAGMRINHWHGPGAISSFALKTRNIDNVMNRVVPDGVAKATQYAYAGGRFELFRMGYHHDKVYSYDIRSAYPSAIVNLPNLKDGQWSHVNQPARIVRFGVYRIRYQHPELFSTRPHPFFYRDPRYAIHFPNVVEGWYWSPEAAIAKAIPHAIVLEGWEFDENSDDRPFSWVEEVYEQRAQWKRDGNPSQIALKLLLNSMYGKMAQRVGWERFGGPPKWHQLEWAGYVTSWTRAKMFSAMVEANAQNALLGVETDGIFSTVPLTLDVGPGLGQWELSEYDSMIYLQSGFYFKKSGKDWTPKYRGFDKGSVTVDDAITTLAKWKPWETKTPYILGTTTRFTTMGMYLQMPSPESWRNVWVTAPRDLKLGVDGKRIHRAGCCTECAAKLSPVDVPHSLSVFDPTGGTSIPHNLPWIGKDINPFRIIVELDGVPVDITLGA